MLPSSARPSKRPFSARGISESIIFKLRNHFLAPSDGTVDALSLYYSRPDCCKDHANIAADTFSHHFLGEPNQRLLASQSSEPHGSEPHGSGPHGSELCLCTLEPYVFELHPHVFEPSSHSFRASPSRIRASFCRFSALLRP